MKPYQTRKATTRIRQYFPRHRSITQYKKHTASSNWGMTERAFTSKKFTKITYYGDKRRNKLF